MSINKNILHVIHNPPKIKKIKLPSFRSPKGIFRVPRDNSFFLKIQQKSPLKDASIHTTDIQSIHKHDESSLKRSISLISSHKNDEKLTSGIHISPTNMSLPKLVKKRPNKLSIMNERQIYRSEWQSFTFESIMKQQIKQRQRTKLLKLLEENAIKKLHSFGSQEQALDEEKQLQKQQKQREYDEYDKYLMQRQPVVYKERHFRLKHKASWVYTK